MGFCDWHTTKKCQCFKPHHQTITTTAMATTITNDDTVIDNNNSAVEKNFNFSSHNHRETTTSVKAKKYLRFKPVLQKVANSSTFLSPKMFALYIRNSSSTTVSLTMTLSCIVLLYAAVILSKES